MQTHVVIETLSCTNDLELADIDSSIWSRQGKTHVTFRTKHTILNALLNALIYYYLWLSIPLGCIFEIIYVIFIAKPFDVCFWCWNPNRMLLCKTRMISSISTWCHRCQTMRCLSFVPHSYLSVIWLSLCCPDTIHRNDSGH